MGNITVKERDGLCQGTRARCTNASKLDTLKKFLLVKYKGIINHHYENTPIQIHRKFYHEKMAIFQIKNSNIFHISAQNIDCGYSLEPPRRGGSNEYLNLCF